MDERNQNEFENNQVTGNEQTGTGAGSQMNEQTGAGAWSQMNEQKTQSVEYQDSTYDSESLNQNHRVEDVSRYTSQIESNSPNTEQGGSTYRIFPESPTNPPEPDKRKKEKKPGTGMTWSKTIAAAVIVGLVAGSAFKGIDIAYDHAKGGDTATVKEDKQTVSNVETASTISEGQVMAYDVSDMAENVMPSIVSITTKSVETIQTWFKQYQQEVEGSGSGIIIEQHNNSLYILTNYHVVQGSTSLTVGFHDSSMVEATVKGYNADADLAVVEVDMTKMSSTTVDAIKLATLGDSDKIEVGQPAIAIGNALGYGQSLTGGYISATNRVLEDSPLALIQTDAAINPGNSGGALFNATGEVIGINSSKLVDSKVEGMGFAIPINKAMELMRGIIDGTSGNVESGSSSPEDYYGNGNDFDDFFNEFFGGGQGGNGSDQWGNDDGSTTEQQIQQSNNKAFLGIVGTDVTEEYSSYLNMPEGVYITQVTDNSPAEAAGLLAGDVIISVDGQTYKEMKELSAYIGQKNPGDSISITFQRKNDNGSYETKTVTATLAENTNVQ